MTWFPAVYYGGRNERPSLDEEDGLRTAREACHACTPLQLAVPVVITGMLGVVVTEGVHLTHGVTTGILLVVQGVVEVVATVVLDVVIVGHGVVEVVTTQLVVHGVIEVVDAVALDEAEVVETGVVEVVPGDSELVMVDGTGEVG